jgi:hypothetical protein
MKQETTGREPAQAREDEYIQKELLEAARKSAAAEAALAKEVRVLIGEPATPDLELLGLFETLTTTGSEASPGGLSSLGYSRAAPPPSGRTVTGR